MQELGKKTERLSEHSKRDEELLGHVSYSLFAWVLQIRKNGWRAKNYVPSTPPRWFLMKVLIFKSHTFEHDVEVKGNGKYQLNHSHWNGRQLGVSKETNSWKSGRKQTNLWIYTDAIYRFLLVYLVDKQAAANILEEVASDEPHEWPIKFCCSVVFSHFN